MKAFVRIIVFALILTGFAGRSLAQVGQGNGIGNPTSKILSPANGQVFYAPVDIQITAFVTPHGSEYAFETVKSAEFFANSTSLGFGSLGFCLCDIETLQGRPLVPSVLVWSNTPPGEYELTVKATDSNGVSVVSAPVIITVLQANVTPTNFPSIVSLTTTDPIAVAGTNCWTWVGLTNPLPTWSNWTTAGAARIEYTNCGPKDALFTVRRIGPTNESLTVNYSVGGTAVQGVDYMTLTNPLVIPAGEQLGFIVIDPIQVSISRPPKTVILKLAPSSNSPPDYVIGFPPSAAALMLEQMNLPPRSGMLADRCFHLTGPGPNGAWFHIEYSDDLRTWTPICTNQVFNGSIDFVDPGAQTDAQRCYRAVPENGPPQ